MPDAWTPVPTTQLGGVAVTTLSRAALGETLVADAERTRGSPRPPRLIFDVNGHGLALAASDPAYRGAMAHAGIVHADGGFLVTLSRWLGTRIAERSATTDMIHDLADVAAARGFSFYLLGGTERVNARCAALLAERHPGLVIAGRRHGYFADDALDEVAADVRAAAPDVIWVGLGKPREQALSVELARRVTATWLVTCGGCYNFVTGDYSRAPRWMQEANLEWLHRLASDPRRLFWRYAVTNPVALWIVLTRRTRRA